jgi:hypothetical protein
MKLAIFAVAGLTLCAQTKAPVKPPVVEKSAFDKATLEAY